MAKQILLVAADVFHTPSKPSLQVTSLAFFSLGTIMEGTLIDVSADQNIFRD